MAVKHPLLSHLNPRVSSSSSARPLSLFSHFHQPPHHHSPSTTAVPKSSDSAKRASSTLPTTPKCRVLTLCNLYFSFSWVLILSSSPPFLLHWVCSQANKISNSGIGPIPAMVEADMTRPSHIGIDWDFEPWLQVPSLTPTSVAFRDGVSCVRPPTTTTRWPFCFKHSIKKSLSKGRAFPMIKIFFCLIHPLLVGAVMKIFTFKH